MPGTREHWKDSTHCFRCTTTFTYLKWQHHCRSCGHSICLHCTAPRKCPVVPSSREGDRSSAAPKMKKVCRSCYADWLKGPPPVLSPSKRGSEAVDDCAICLEALVGDIAKLCPLLSDTPVCSHAFHKHCVAQLPAMLCPLCRCSFKRVTLSREIAPHRPTDRGPHAAADGPKPATFSPESTVSSLASSHRSRSSLSSSALNLAARQVRFEFEDQPKFSVSATAHPRLYAAAYII
eukprot:gene8273-12764_t